jgi:hypothetical protein
LCAASETFRRIEKAANTLLKLLEKLTRTRFGEKLAAQ